MIMSGGPQPWASYAPSEPKQLEVSSVLLVDYEWETNWATCPSGGPWTLKDKPWKVTRVPHGGPRARQRVERKLQIVDFETAVRQMMVFYMLR